MLPFHHQELVRSVFQMFMGESFVLDEISFNFSGLKGQTRVGRDGLHYYSKRVTLVLASSNHDFLDELIRRIFAFDTFYLGALHLEPEVVERELVEVPNASTVRYLCISPLMISFSESRLQNKLFLHPESPDFGKHLLATINKRLQYHQVSIDEPLSEENFAFKPDMNYLNKLMQNGKKFARIYTVKYQGRDEEVRGYTLPFELKAPTAVQNFVFKNGFGEFTQHGFGMIDLANQSATQRSVYYERKGATSEQEMSAIQRNMRS